MNSLSAFENAIVNKKECLIIIDKISDLYKFTKNLSKKLKLDIYEFSENLFILKNNYDFIIFRCVYELEQINFIISFIPIDNDDVLTDDYSSDDDCKTDNEF
jgi:hypothetical protein